MAAAIPAAVAALIESIPLIIAAAQFINQQNSNHNLHDAIKATAESAKEDTTAKTATPSATSKCTSGQPDDNCCKWLDQAKQALYSAKKPKEIGGDGKGSKGIMQMLCEWRHGTSPDGANHSQAVTDMMTSLKKALTKLSNPNNNCTIPDEISNDIKTIHESINLDGSGLGNLPHTPRNDFKDFCYQQASTYSQKHFDQLP